MLEKMNDVHSMLSTMFMDRGMEVIDKFTESHVSQCRYLFKLAKIALFVNHSMGTWMPLENLRELENFLDVC